MSLGKQARNLGRFVYKVRNLKSEIGARKYKHSVDKEDYDSTSTIEEMKVDNLDDILEDMEISDNIEEEKYIESKEKFKFGSIFGKIFKGKGDKDEFLPPEELKKLENIPDEEPTESKEKFKFGSIYGKIFKGKRDKDEFLPPEELKKLDNIPDEESTKSKEKIDKTLDETDPEEMNLETNSNEKNKLNIKDKVFDYLSNTKLDYKDVHELLVGLDIIRELEKEEQLSNFIDNGDSIDPNVRYIAIMKQIYLILEIQDEMEDIQEESYNDEAEQEEESNKIENTVENEVENNIEDKVFDYLSGICIDDNMKKELSRYINVINELNLANELKTYIDSVGYMIFPQVKYELLIDEMDRIINEVSNNRSTSESTAEEDEMDGINNDTSNNRSTSESTAEEDEMDSNIPTINYEENKEKCKKYYDLYQERMEKIQPINDEIVALKEYLKIMGSQILDPAKLFENKAKIKKRIRELENSIEALSIRLTILEKTGYVKAYQEKLNDDKKRQKENELNNYSILETFSDEELEKIYASGMYQDESKMETLMEFKMVMKM